MNTINIGFNINENNKIYNNQKLKQKVNFKSGMSKELIATSAKEASTQLIKMKKLVVINGSPRSDKISNTYKALQAETEFFKKRYPNLETTYFKLPRDMNGCFACAKCTPGCVQKGDNFKNIVDEMKDATDVLIGSPVYLDMPTTQIVAFFTRLSSLMENTDREFFKDKRAWLLSTAFCSGVKTCLHTMMGACEMLGFTLPGRCTREYVIKWDDKKLRGGMSRNDAIFLE